MSTFFYHILNRSTDSIAVKPLFQRILFGCGCCNFHLSTHLLLIRERNWRTSLALLFCLLPSGCCSLDSLLMLIVRSYLHLSPYWIVLLLFSICLVISVFRLKKCGFMLSTYLMRLSIFIMSVVPFLLFILVLVSKFKTYLLLVVIQYGLLVWW